MSSARELFTLGVCYVVFLHQIQQIHTSLELISQTPATNPQLSRICYMINVVSVYLRTFSASPFSSDSLRIDKLGTFYHCYILTITQSDIYE